jgi:hypothetical protein
MKTYFEGEGRTKSILDSIRSESFACASPRVIILVTPYLDLNRRQRSLAQDLILKWLAAISVAPHTEELAGSVVDTLLQIAADRHLRPSIPADVWLWLNERPPLPSVCAGRLWGGNHGVVRTVRGLNNIRILTSYLILTWSEWNPLHSNGFAEMRVSICEDLNGIGMGCYRAELIQRLDYILGELDRRAGCLDGNLEDEWLWRREVGGIDNLPVMKDRYGELKRILQEVDQEVTKILNRMPHSFIFPSLLTLMDLHRIALHLHVCPASPVSMTSHLERSALLRRTALLIPIPCHRRFHAFSPSTWNSRDSALAYTTQVLLLHQ